MIRVIAYHIFFTTYGTWLHGDSRGSWDKHQSEKLASDRLLEERRRCQLRHSPTTMTEEMRTAVDGAIRDVCQFRGWHLYALNVRTNHVHVVVAAHVEAQKMMHDFKAYATRRLRGTGLVAANVRVWTAKGGIKGVTHPEGLADLIDYVVNGQ